MTIQRNESQEARALALLKSRGESWTPAPELAKISLQYCRVIACLRRRGFQIENRTETQGRTKHGFYRLIKPIPTSEKSARAEIDAGLFSTAELERGAAWRDEG